MLLEVLSFESKSQADPKKNTEKKVAPNAYARQPVGRKSRNGKTNRWVENTQKSLLTEIQLAQKFDPWRMPSASKILAALSELKYGLYAIKMK